MYIPTRLLYRRMPEFYIHLQYPQGGRARAFLGLELARSAAIDVYIQAAWDRRRGDAAPGPLLRRVVHRRTASPLHRLTATPPHHHVTTHTRTARIVPQDSTFLYTTPRVTCLGLWLALEDATLDNGCLWARPGSHKEPVRKKFVRNKAYFEPAEPNESTNGTDSSNPSMMKFIDHEDEAARVVSDYDSGADAAADPEAHGFVPLPVKAGSLVAIHGSLDHLSLPNTSPKSRHTFQLHLVEGRDAGVTWSAGNWLQYSSGEPFPMLAKSAEFVYAPVEGASSRAEL